MTGFGIDKQTGRRITGDMNDSGMHGFPEKQNQGNHDANDERIIRFGNQGKTKNSRRNDAVIPVFFPQRDNLPGVKQNQYRTDDQG